MRSSKGGKCQQEINMVRCSHTHLQAKRTKPASLRARCDSHRCCHVTECLRLQLQLLLQLHCVQRFSLATIVLFACRRPLLQKTFERGATGRQRLARCTVTGLPRPAVATECEKSVAARSKAVFR